MIRLPSILLGLAGVLALALAAIAPAPASATADKPAVVNPTTHQFEQIPAGDTLQLPAPAAQGSANFKPGSAPSAPNNGDCWVQTSGTPGYYCEVGGAAVGPLGAGGVTSITQGTGLNFSVNPCVSTCTIGIANTAVTAGTYAIATVTVNAQGQITSASAAATTGSGNVVLATSPTLTTPNLGTPSALDLLHATDLTSAAVDAICSTDLDFFYRSGGSWGCHALTSGDITGALGFTPLSSVPNCSQSASSASAEGCLGAPGSTKTSNYTLAAGDAAGFLTMNCAGACTLTVPPNSGAGSVAFPTWTVIPLGNVGGGTLTISSTDTIETGSGGSIVTGSVTVPVGGVVSLQKIASTTWLVSGTMPGALILLEEHTVSAASSQAFTGWYSAAFDHYLIDLKDMVPSSNAGTWDLRVSGNGGSTYDTTSGHYNTSTFSWSTGGTGVSGAGSSSAIVFYPGINGRSVSTAANQSMQGRIDFYNPNSATLYQGFIGDMLGPDSANTTANPQNASVRAYYTGLATFNAFSIFITSGTFNGTIRVYGVAK